MADIDSVFDKLRRHYRGGRSAHLLYAELKTLVLWLEDIGYTRFPANRPITLTEESVVSEPEDDKF